MLLRSAVHKRLSVYLPAVDLDRVEMRTDTAGELSVLENQVHEHCFLNQEYSGLEWQHNHFPSLPVAYFWFPDPKSHRNWPSQELPIHKIHTNAVSFLFQRLQCAQKNRVTRLPDHIP